MKKITLLGLLMLAMLAPSPARAQQVVDQQPLEVVDPHPVDLTVPATSTRTVRKTAPPVLACNPAAPESLSSVGQKRLYKWFDWYYLECGWLCFATPAICPCYVIYF